MGDPTHYEVLGVTVRASADEVRAAYRRAARDHHPDAGGSARRMSEVNAAWYVLGDAGRRAAYDRQLARRPATAPGAGPSPAPPPGPFGPGGTGDGWAVDADAYRSAEEWADLADGTPVREGRSLDGWWAILPPATLLSSIGLLAAAFVFTAPALLAVAGGMFMLAAGLFVLAPLRAMSRKDPR
ncbi:MAG TPA: DnaJ domain-containing protein [Acidimicrobiales bacterium]|nr:DnaJ domain-containing protein [Acidimicrobiales bacterium]